MDCVKLCGKAAATAFLDCEVEAQICRFKRFVAADDLIAALDAPTRTAELAC